MKTNHEMNYYNYGKTLDAQGVMPVIKGGGVNPEPTPAPFYPETLTVYTEDYTSGSRTSVLEDSASRDYDQIRIFKVVDSEEVTLTNMYIDAYYGWVGQLLTYISSLSGYKAEYIIQGEPIAQGNANFVISQ